MGVKSDTIVELNTSWMETNSVSLRYDFAPEATTYRIYVWKAEDHYNTDRLLAGYNNSGYSGDFPDTVTDVKQGVGYITFTKVTNW